VNLAFTTNNTIKTSQKPSTRQTYITAVKYINYNAKVTPEAHRTNRKDVPYKILRTYTKHQEQQVQYWIFTTHSEYWSQLNKY
jgi:hypothetical protein